MGGVMVVDGYYVLIALLGAGWIFFNSRSSDD
jgi:hypothetical protein